MSETHQCLLLRLKTRLCPIPPALQIKEDGEREGALPESSSSQRCSVDDYSKSDSEAHRAAAARPDMSWQLAI